MFLNRCSVLSRCIISATQPCRTTISRRFLSTSTTKNSDKDVHWSELPLSEDAKKNKDKTLSKNEKVGSPFLSEKFKVFTEENAPLILDVEEEKQKLLKSTRQQETEDWRDEEKFSEVDHTRGLRGVFDVEQLVELLQSDGAIDTFVAELPHELRYAEHIVIVTGRSARHRKALAQLVRRVYKFKRNPDETVPRIEGDHASGDNVDWLAMDLGNIVLHIFARAAREKYDLESLWTLGATLDKQCSDLEEDPVAQLMRSHSVFLSDLEPADPKSPLGPLA